MSDESMRETVAEEAAEQIDVAKLISGDNIQEGVNAKEMGITIGRRAGERMGRSVGETVGETVHEIFTPGSGNRNVWEIGVDAKQSAASWINERTDEGREQIEEGQQRVKVEAAKVRDDLPSIENMDRETLDEMSDRDLESVAEEVGVKADQAREEMTTKILEAVPGHEESDEGDDGTTARPGDFS